MIDKTANYYKYNSSHADKIFGSATDYLEQIYKYITDLDKYLNKCSLVIANYQISTYTNSVQLYFENGYWKIFKVDIKQHKFNLIGNKDNFYYTYKRVSFSNIGHLFKDTKNFNMNETNLSKLAKKNRTNIKQLILISAEIAEHRNHIVSKIANSFSGIKRLNLKEDLIEKFIKILITYETNLNK